MVVGRGRRFRVAPDMGLSDRGPSGVPRRAGPGAVGAPRRPRGAVAAPDGRNECTGGRGRRPRRDDARSLVGHHQYSDRAGPRTAARRGDAHRPRGLRHRRRTGHRPARVDAARGSRSRLARPRRRDRRRRRPRRVSVGEAGAAPSLPDPFAGMEDLLKSVLDRTQRRILQPGPAPGPRSNGAPQIREGWLSLRRLEQLAP